MKSLWQEYEIRERKPLDGNAKTDILIIGGGIAGILLARELQNRGADYLLVEGKRIASGVTGGTTGKITAQHGLIYGKIIKEKGIQTAKKYFSANQSAVEKYKYIYEGGGLDCDFEVWDSAVFSRDASEITAEYKALRSLGIGAVFYNRLPPVIEAAGGRAAVGIPNQAQFHVRKFIGQISEGLNIYENTFVRKIEKNLAMTDCGKIQFNRAVIATHFPIINRMGMYFAKMHQFRTYLAAAECDVPLPAMFVDSEDGGMTFRRQGSLLIYGGGGHKTGKRGDCRAFNNFAARNLSNCVEKYKWAAQDCISHDGIPYIGKYSALSENIYVTTGFNKWGISSAMVSADLISDLLEGKKNEFEEIYSPSRSCIGKNLFANVASSAAGLLTPTVPRCPHMGCALKKNRLEGTWDCPCHGSRFTSDGLLLDNPSVKNMRRARKVK